MKKLCALLLVLFVSIQMTKAQNIAAKANSIPVSALTELMIEKYYSVTQRNELAENPVKLKSLDYIFSKSFEVGQGQEYGETQFQKIDVVKLDVKRKVNEDVIVFDEVSGLNILLYSLNKVEEEKSKIDPSYISLKKRQNKSTN